MKRAHLLERPIKKEPQWVDTLRLLFDGLPDVPALGLGGASG